MTKSVKTFTLDEVKDHFIGEAGTAKREAYETELEMELIGELIKRIRKEKALTQAELGELIGVKKAQISKIERSAKNVSLRTLIRVFDALNTKVKLTVEV